MKRLPAESTLLHKVEKRCAGGGPSVAPVPLRHSRDRPARHSPDRLFPSRDIEVASRIYRHSHWSSSDALVASPPSPEKP